MGDENSLLLRTLEQPGYLERKEQLKSRYDIDFDLIIGKTAIIKYFSQEVVIIGLIRADRIVARLPNGDVDVFHPYDLQY